MSIAQIHLKGRATNEIDDPVMVYFCFPTLGVAVPLHPGDFILLILAYLTASCGGVSPSTAEF